MKMQSPQLIDNPLVSVVIPSYNRAGTVSKTINSILNQKCDFGIEIIIGDDCSTDNAREVLLEYYERYPTNIVLLFHENNIGLAANWASCVKLCRGKYLANCDNDDYWHNLNKLQLQVDFLENHSEYGVVHSDYRILNRKTGKQKEIFASNYKYKEPLQKSIFNGEFKFCNATMMYRLQLVQTYVNLCDYIRFQFTLQDWNTWVILSNYTNFFCLPVSTATLCVETESVTRPQGYDKMKQRLLKEKELYKYICNLFPFNFPYVESEYDVYINKVLLNMAYVIRDYRSAKGFGIELKKLNFSNAKVICSQYVLFFYFFVLIKKMRSGFEL